MNATLFDQLPAQSHSVTSVAAAASMKPHAGRLRDVVLQAIAAAPATDEEIALRTGLAGNTVRPRRVELQRAGLVEECGKRKTASGRNAVVWKVTNGNR